MGAGVFVAFATWGEVLDHVNAGRPIYYQAPLDWRPWYIGAQAYKNGKIRVRPTSRDVDPFTADSAHLGRFFAVDRDYIRSQVAQG